MPYKDAITARDYHRQYQRLRRSGVCQTPNQTRIPVEFRLRTASDVAHLLEQQALVVRDDANLTTCERARTIGYLCSIALRAIEAGDIAARLEAVEGVFRGRSHEI